MMQYPVPGTGTRFAAFFLRHCCQIFAGFLSGGQQGADRA